MDSQTFDQIQDINLLWLIFAAMACYLPVYYGFKKSIKQGIVNISAVLAVLFFFFTVPSFQSFMMVLFAVYIIVGLIVSIKKNVF